MTSVYREFLKVGVNLRAFVIALAGMVFFGAGAQLCLRWMTPMMELSQWGFPTTAVVIVGSQILLFLCLISVGAVALWEVSGWSLLRSLSWLWLLVFVELGKQYFGTASVPVEVFELVVVGCLGVVALVMAPRVVHSLGELWTIKILPVVKLARALWRKAQPGDLRTPSRISLSATTLDLMPAVRRR